MKGRFYTPYLYILPGLILVLGFVYIPILTNVRFSFYRLSSYSVNQVFVGFKNYARMLTDPVLPLLLRNNIYYAVISLLIQVGFGTTLAVLLETRFAGKLRNVYRNIYFLPALISLTAVGLLWQFVYTPDMGLINEFLRKVGLNAWTHAWLGESKIAMFSIIAMSQWQFTGYVTVLMIVAFQKIPNDFLEAAAIDGASSARVAWNILIPLAKEQLMVCSIITIIGAFKLFTEVYVTTQGGPGNSTHVLGTYLYQNAFLYDDMGLASALGILIFVITISTSILQLKVGKSGKI